MCKKIISLLLVFSLLMPFNVFASDISAKSMILIDADNGRVIFSKNENEVLPMASTTKIMSALLVLESGLDLQEFFTVDPTAIMVEGTSMGLKKGDKVNLYALCVGMLLSSGNDAANAAAVRVSGSVENFVSLMNKRAKQLGLKDTHFATPSGLDGENHHTTAKELALITKQALKNETFKSICSKISITVSFGAPPFNRTLYNHNRLLRQYSGTVGVKTGFTKKSGRCLVSACERDGVKLICVTLNAPNDWSDHTKLYDQAFSTLSHEALTNDDDYAVKVTGGEMPSVVLKEQSVGASLNITEYKDVKKHVETPPFVYAPVNIGDKCGEAVYTLYGEEIARTPLLATQSVGKLKTSQNFFKKLWQKIGEKLWQTNRQ